MSERPTRDRWALDLAFVTARRGTCLRRAVGCVLLDAAGRVLATGYNGVARGQPHCNAAELIERPHGRPTRVYPHACAAAGAASGTQLDGCEAVHAEQNALIQCRDVDAIETCAVTASPCLTCVKMLLNTSCRRIVFAERYPHAEAERLWTRPGGPGAAREWLELSPEA